MKDWGRVKSYGWETGTRHFAIDGVTRVTAVTMPSVYHQAAGKRYCKNESCNDDATGKRSNSLKRQWHIIAAHQTAVVQKVDSAMHRINHFPADKY